MQSKDVLNPSSCWVPSGFPVLALGSHTTGVDKSKPTKQKSLTLIHPLGQQGFFLNCPA